MELFDVCAAAVADGKLGWMLGADIIASRWPALDTAAGAPAPAHTSHAAPAPTSLKTAPAARGKEQRRCRLSKQQDLSCGAPTTLSAPFLRCLFILGLCQSKRHQEGHFFSSIQIIRLSKS